jgi:hypothetical protein
MGPKRTAPTLGAISGAFEDAEQLTDTADEQAFLVNLHPDARRGGEDDVVARLDRHLNADVIPPVEARPNGEHDSLLRRWLVGSGRYEQPGPPEPIGVELLDDDAVEEGAKLVAHDSVR